MRMKSWLGVMVLVAAHTAPAAQPAPQYFMLHPLGHRVWAAIARPGSPAGSNAGFVVGSKAVAVVDTFEDPDAARALLAAIRRSTDLPVRYVVDTHYHLDHVAGNNVFAAAGALVFAQRNVRFWERTENLKFFGKDITDRQRRMVASLGLPSVSYREGVDLDLGGRTLVVRVLPGHTGGDSAAIVPDADVVFTGDLFWNHTLPNLIDADTGAQIHSDDVFVRDYPHATFVPGHGDVGDAADVRRFRDYLMALRRLVAAARAGEASRNELVDTVLPKLRDHYGGWGWFDHFARPNIEQTAAELAGNKRVPIPGQP